MPGAKGVDDTCFRFEVAGKGDGVWEGTKVVAFGQDVGLQIHPVVRLATSYRRLPPGVRDDGNRESGGRKRGNRQTY